MEQAAVPPVEKKGKGRMVGILVALVLVLSAGAAGAVFAPRLLAKGKPAPADTAAAAEGESTEAAEDEPDAEHADEATETEEEPAPAAQVATGEPPVPKKQRAGTVGQLQELAPIVVDSRADDGSVRHVKVVLVVEYPKTLPEEEFKNVVPFAREAAIAYLRTRDYEQLADPKKFELVRRQLASEIIDAVGKKHARRVLITDYVVQ